MSIFGAAALGGGLGALGSIFGGNSEKDAANQQNAFLRGNQAQSLGFLRASQFGNLPYGEFTAGNKYAGYPPSLRAEFERIDALEQDANLLPKTRKKLAKQRAKLMKEARAYESPAIGEAGLRDLYGADAPGRLAEFDRLYGEAGAESAKARESLKSELTKLEPGYDDLIGQANAYGGEARAAAQQGYEQATRAGVADVTRSAAARNVANSSIPENARLGVYARTGANLAGTLADIEGRRYGMLDAAKRNKIAGLQSAASALSGFDTNEAQRRQSLLSGRFGLFSGIADRPIQSFERSNQLSSQTFNPQALYPQYQVSAGSTGRQFGNALSGLGGQIAGYGLRSFFEPPQQQRNPFSYAGAY